MAFTGNFMCTSFKVQLMEGVHDFRPTTGDVFKLALYDNNASFTAATTAYTSVNEVANSGSYTAGGGILTPITPTSSGVTAYTSFADLSFTGATITAYGALIYNSTPNLPYTNPAVCVLDFGGPKTSSSGTFTIVFPTADSSDAIIRIGV
jgi:hypothetical protein